MSSSRRGEKLRALAALLLGVGLSAALAAGGIHALGGLGWSTALTRELVLALGATVALLAVGRFVERRPLAALGFARAHALRDVLLGALSGTALIAAVIGVLALCGAYTVRAVHFPVEILARYFVLMVLVAWFEEVLFRGIVFRVLDRLAGPVVALVVSAALFGGVHFTNAQGTVIAAVAIAVEAGVLLGAAFLLTRSLWLPIGMHLGWNFAEGPLFGAPISGETTPSILVADLPGPAWLDGDAFGPEAGLVAVVAGALVAAALLWAARRRAFFIAETPPKPDASI